MLIRQIFAYLPAQILGPLMQFAAAIALTHWLGASDYGVTMLIFASQELVFLLCLSWWSASMLRYSGSIATEDARMRYRETEGAVMLYTAIAQIVATIIIVFTAKPEAGPGFYLGACFFTLTRSALNFLSERARERAAISAYSLIQIIAPLGGLILSIAMLQSASGTPALVLPAFGIAQLLVIFLVARRLDFKIWPGTLDREFLDQALGFGIPIVISGALGWVAANGIRFVVQSISGPVELGLLTVAWSIAVRLAASAALTVTAAGYPLAVKSMALGDHEGAKAQVGVNSALLLACVAPATAGLIAINEPLVRLLVAPEFQAMTIALLPAALIGASIRNFRMHGWDLMYLLFERSRSIVMIELLEASLTLGFVALGLLMRGLTGAVEGALVAAILVATLDGIYLKRRLGLHIPFSQISRILLASLAIYAVLSILPALGWSIRAHWLDITLAVIVGIITYGLALILLFPAEVQQARGWLRQYFGQANPS